MTTASDDLIGMLRAEGDFAHVFGYHPFNIELAEAHGIWLQDTAGRRYIDASGGPMAVNIGHGDPRMKAAIAAQLDHFAYCHPMLANRPRAELAAAIARHTPPGLSAVYLVSGGSEAVETALKLARQYWVAEGRPGKHKVVSNFESYHGMTLATMGLSGNPGVLRAYDPMVPHWPKVPQFSQAGRPDDVTIDDWVDQSLAQIERCFHYEGADTIAAFIATPHGCGSDYGLVAPRRYWEGVRALCDAFDILFIADEVVTGFGRTGAWFAMEHFGVVPDLMTIAKGMSGCAMPLGGVVVSDRVRAPFDEGRAYFVHGFTHGGHALACAAGLATIRILEEDRLVESVAAKHERLFSYRERLLAHPSVADVRGWGLFMVLELVEDKASGTYFAPERGAEQLFQKIAFENGLAFYSTLYGPRRRPLMSRGLPMWISPPLIITEAEIDLLMERLDRTLDIWERSLGLAADARSAAS